MFKREILLELLSVFLLIKYQVGVTGEKDCCRSFYKQREKAGGHGRVARAQGWGGVERNCEVVYQAQGRTWCFLLSSRTTVCCPDSLRKWTTMKTQSPGPVPRGVSNGKEPQRQELKRCRLENSSAGWLEHGDGHSEPEAEWESSEPQCIHNSSSPEPRTKSWDLMVGRETYTQILVKLHQSLRERKKACGLDGSDLMSWVKFPVEDSSSILKPCPDQNSLVPVPAALTNWNTIGTWLCLSEIFESSRFGECCCFLSLKYLSWVQSEVQGWKAESSVAEGPAPQQGQAAEGALHAWEVF